MIPHFPCAVRPGDAWCDWLQHTPRSTGREAGTNHHDFLENMWTKTGHCPQIPLPGDMGSCRSQALSRWERGSV